MKKTVVYLAFLAFIFFSYGFSANAQSAFLDAIKTCENYSKDGTIKHKGESFNISISLKKTRKNNCVYKEKIHQENGYQMLTCNFLPNQLEYIHDSMQRFSQEFKKQIAKNDIFEAKLTTNGEIFQKYLIDKQYCKITYSKK